MRRDCTNICCLACIVYICTSLGTPTPANGEDVQIALDLLPGNGRRTGNPVILNLKGKTYSKSGWFDQMVAGRADPAEQFIIDVSKKYKNGSLTQIRNLWMPDEQAEIVRYLSGSRMSLAERQAYFRRMTRSRFLCKVHYGNYVIFVVRSEFEGYEDSVNHFTVKKLKGRFYLTNQLGSDPILSKVAEFAIKIHPHKK